MKLFTIQLLGLASVSAFAGQTGSEKSPPVLKKPMTLYETWDNDGVNLGVRGDLLYMVYQAPVLTYASLQTTTDDILRSKVLSVPGHASFGCNVAVMYTMPHQPGYSFESSWYHIVAQFSRHIAADNIAPAHSATLISAAPGTAAVHAHMTINLFDLVIKKDFSFGNWFAVTPTMGLVGGYMNGKNRALFNATSGSFSSIVPPNTASTSADLFYSTKFEGIGIKLGANTSFKIWKGFKLRGELFYNVLYGLSKANLNYSQNGLSLGATVGGATATYSQHHARSFFDSLLGLAWETRFNNDAQYINLHVGWRFQAFFDGWKELEAELNNSIHELGLTGQGLQAGITFKF